MLHSHVTHKRPVLGDFETKEKRRRERQLRLFLFFFSFFVGLGNQKTVQVCGLRENRPGSEWQSIYRPAERGSRAKFSAHDFSHSLCLLTPREKEKQTKGNGVFWRVGRIFAVTLTFFVLFCFFSLYTHAMFKTSHTYTVHTHVPDTQFRLPRLG